MINGRIRSTPNSSIAIWAFWNPQLCDGFGDPEAQNPIAVTVSNTDAQGRGQWTIDLVLDPPPPPGSAITATATSPADSTSEISACVPMQP